ncbi:MAG: tetratricopeptide repeat protein, partial [Desulfosarcina sp.]|nr:tetratricopeptide repeat protein [Desulfobacterales bacterium]
MATRSIGIILTLVLISWGGPATVRAESIRNQFFRAEGAYKNLMNAPSRQKYRHHWLRVIEKFEAVYKRDPGGDWASVSLYRAGVIWLELNRFSGRKADREIGIERLQTVVEQFPKSAYRSKAQARLRQQGASVPRAASRKIRADARKRYAAAERCRQRLEKNPRHTKHRDVWLQCIDQYEAAYKADPGTETAARSLLYTGELYLALSRYSRSADDRENGKRFLERVVKDHPDSPSAAAARKSLGVSGKPEKAAGAVVVPKSTPIDLNKPPSSAGASSAGRTVTELRFWSNPNY